MFAKNANEVQSYEEEKNDFKKIADLFDEVIADVIPSDC